MRLAKGILVASFSLFGLVGCANAADDGEPVGNDEVTGSTSAELRPLQDNEKLGTITYGQSKTVNYSENPLYRAYSFSATAGDSVDILVHSTTANDPVAFLLASDYTTLSSNDNANSNTKDARIIHQIPSTGTYWLAFREVNQESATFTVSLNANSAPANVFDPNLCAGGTTFNRDQVVRYFAPGANTSSILANVTAYRRRRNCNKVTGCGEWRANPSNVTWSYDNAAINSASVRAKVASDSSIDLYFKRTDADTNAAFHCDNLASSGSLSCDNTYIYGSGGSSGYWTYIKDGVVINAGSYSTSTLTASTTCFQNLWKGTNYSQYESDYVESEIAFYGATLPPTN